MYAGRHPPKGKAGPGRIAAATVYSIRGLAAAWRHEAAFRLELLLAAVLVPAAFWIDTSALERAVLIASVLLVLVVELLNSALEAAVDRVSAEEHPLAARAKDMGSAAVCMSLVNVAVVWALVVLG